MWETFTPEDQGFLINVNRIRVSRDLRTTRKGAPKDIRLIFLNLIIWRKEGRNSDTATLPTIWHVKECSYTIDRQIR